MVTPFRINNITVVKVWSMFKSYFVLILRAVCYLILAGAMAIIIGCILAPPPQ